MFDDCNGGTGGSQGSTWKKAGASGKIFGNRGKGNERWPGGGMGWGEVFQTDSVSDGRGTAEPYGNPCAPHFRYKPANSKIVKTVLRFTHSLDMLSRALVKTPPSIFKSCIYESPLIITNTLTTPSNPAFNTAILANINQFSCDSFIVLSYLTQKPRITAWLLRLTQSRRPSSVRQRLRVLLFSSSSSAVAHL